MWILHRYLRWRLRRAFHCILKRGNFEQLEDSSLYPLVLFSTHSSWWDGFFLEALFDAYAMEYYVMMEEKNLAKFPYFQKVGVFGVDLESESGKASSLLYASRLLRGGRDCRRTLLIFPHGRLVLPDEAPPPFQPGLEALLKIMRQGHAVPVSLDTWFTKYPLPVASIALGEAIPVETNPTTEILSQALDQCREAHPPVDPGTADAFLLPPKQNFHGQT